MSLQSTTEAFAPGLPSVYADRVLLEQVLLNLLRNALDANRDAHPDPGGGLCLECRLPLGRSESEPAEQLEPTED